MIAIHYLILFFSNFFPEGCDYTKRIAWNLMAPISLWRACVLFWFILLKWGSFFFFFGSLSNGNSFLTMNNLSYEWLLSYNALSLFLFLNQLIWYVDTLSSFVIALIFSKLFILPVLSSLDKHGVAFEFLNINKTNQFKKAQYPTFMNWW